MSLFYRTFECPKCEHRWTLCQERDESPPKFCPECGQKFAATLAAVPGTHRIGGSRTAKSVDETYRTLEEAGAARARLAEAAGLPAASARSLKITNLRDDARVGDVPAMRPTTQLEHQARQFFNLAPGFWGAGSAGPVPQSPIATPRGTFTGAGHVALDSIQRDHRANVAAVKAAGKVATE